MGDDCGGDGIMNTFIINERPLNDDTLYLASVGNVFKGGYIAVLEYYTFANEWNDHKHYKGFRTLATMHAYLAKHYPDFTDEIYQ